MARPASVDAVYRTHDAHIETATAQNAIAPIRTGG
jgi:hypothetical protein